MNNKVFKKKYAEHQMLVKYVINKFTNNKDDAKDLHSEVWKKAYIAKNKFFQGKSYSKWISAVTHNTCIDFLKGKKPEYNIDEIGELEYILSDALMEEERLEKYEILKKALSRMNNEEKFLIISFYFQDLSLKLIGGKFGFSENAAKVRLHRARRKLRDILRDLGYIHS